MKSLLVIFIILVLPIGIHAQVTDTFWLSGTTDVLDNWVESFNPTDNNGTDVQLLYGDGFASIRHCPISFPYLADSVGAFDPGWVLKEARLDMVENGIFIATTTAKAYYLVKPSIEAEATYNRWDNANLKEWGTAGIGSTGDTYNEGDGTGDDRGGTEQGSVVIDGSGLFTMDLDTAWINASVALDSVLSYALIAAGGGLVAFHSSEYTTDTTLTIRLRIIMEEEQEQEVSGGPPDGVIHSPSGAGQIHGPDGSSVRHGP